MPGRGKEILPVAFYRQLVPAGQRGILDIPIRVQIHDIDIIIVGGKRPRDVRVACLLVRVGDGQDGDRDRHIARDGVCADRPREGVRDRAVRQLLIIEGAQALLAAGFHDVVHERPVKFGKAGTKA